jgi:hypothetical protein
VSAHTRPQQDIDVLVVLNEREHPKDTLAALKRFLETLRKKLDFFVVSDSYFIPLIFGYRKKCEIIHLMIYHSFEHFSLSPYSALLHVRPNSTIQNSVQLKRLSWIMGAQDALRFWCMYNLNSLQPVHDQAFRVLQEESINKWFTPTSDITDLYFRKLIKSIRSAKKKK